MDNEIKQPCSEVVYSEKVQRISDMKWAGQKHKAHTGFCQFCGNALEFSYRVFTPDGACHEYAMGSQGAAKAKEQMDANTIKEGVHIYALAACEEMTDEELYRRGICHYEQRSDDWREKVKQEAIQRSRTTSPSPNSAGESW
jgi:hypothetical protein